MIYKGSTKLGNLYIGSIKIGRIYKGSTLVYEPIKPINFETDTPGTYTIEIPRKMKVYIKMFAGGGGCGHHPSTTNSHSGVGMGGAGGGFLAGVTLEKQTLTVTVGARGTHLFGGYPTGTAGGDSKIIFGDGTYILCTGGKGGSGWKSGGAGGAGGAVENTSSYSLGNIWNGRAGTAQSYCAGVTLGGGTSSYWGADQTDDWCYSMYGGGGKVSLDYRGGTSLFDPATGYFLIEEG